MCPLGPGISMVDRHHTELIAPLHAVSPMVRLIEQPLSWPAADASSAGGGQGRERMLRQTWAGQDWDGLKRPGAGIIKPGSW